jgi:small multidrug resistance pump
MSPATVYLILALAIAAEVVATTALARSDGFTRLAPSLVSVVGYGVAFWLLAITLRVLPTGIVYATWSGLGVVLIAAVAWAWYGQRLDAAAVVGMAFIVVGVVLVNGFSGAVSH